MVVYRFVHRLFRKMPQYRLRGHNGEPYTRILTFFPVQERPPAISNQEFFQLLPESPKNAALGDVDGPLSDS
jgi:hypothetical protein